MDKPVSGCSLIAGSIYIIAISSMIWLAASKSPLTKLSEKVLAVVVLSWLATSVSVGLTVATAPVRWFGVGIGIAYLIALSVALWPTVSQEALVELGGNIEAMIVMSFVFTAGSLALVLLQTVLALLGISFSEEPL